MDDIVKEVLALYDAIKKAPIDPTRRVFIDTMRYPVTKEQAVEFFKGTEVHTHFPDGSEYFNGSLLNAPAPIPAWSASPETLRRLNARIATMDLSPHRRTWEIESERVYGGIWLYDIGRGNMKGGGGPWITD